MPEDLGDMCYVQLQLMGAAFALVDQDRDGFISLDDNEFLNGLLEDFNVIAFEVIEQADMMEDEEIGDLPLVSFDQFIATIDFQGDDTDMAALRTMFIERNAGSMAGGLDLDGIYTLVQGAQSRLTDTAEALRDSDESTLLTVDDVMTDRLDFYGC